MPTFPLIGRDFDALAGQQQFWAGLSNQNEIGNIQRQQAAQQNVNNWLATASQLRDRAQQQNVGLQLSADQQAREEAARREDEARKTSQFAAQLGWSKTSEEARLAAEDRRTVSAENIAKANRDWQDKQIAANLDAEAQLLAMKASPVKKAFDAIDAQVQKAQSDLDALDIKKVALQKKQANKGWFSGGLTEDEKIELGNIPADEKKLQAILNPKGPLMQQHAQYSRALDRIQNQADTGGFDLNFEGGKITHPRSGKSWDFHRAAQGPLGASSTGSMMGPVFTGPAMAITAQAAVQPFLNRPLNASPVQPAPAPPSLAPTFPGQAANDMGGEMGGPTPAPQPDMSAGGLLSDAAPRFAGFSRAPTVTGTTPPPAVTGPAPASPAIIPPAPNDRNAGNLVPGNQYLVRGQPMTWDGDKFTGKGFMGSTTTAYYGLNGYLVTPKRVQYGDQVQEWMPPTDKQSGSYATHYPYAPRNPSQREYGAIYETPTGGPMQWMGNGWQKPT